MALEPLEPLLSRAAEATQTDFDELISNAVDARAEILAWRASSQELLVDLKRHMAVGIAAEVGLRKRLEANDGSPGIEAEHDAQHKHVERVKSALRALNGKVQALERIRNPAHFRRGDARRARDNED